MLLTALSGYFVFILVVFARVGATKSGSGAKSAKGLSSGKGLIPMFKFG